MELKLLQPSITQNDSRGSEKTIYTSHMPGLFVDTETGVNYFVMNCSNAGAICPRFNPDGTLYVSRV